MIPGFTTSQDWKKKTPWTPQLCGRQHNSIILLPCSKFLKEKKRKEKDNNVVNIKR
jgi:hypothetical protein